MIRFDRENHLYFDEKGHILPSATEIIGAVYGTGLELAPAQAIARAAQIGTQVHDEIHQYLTMGKQGSTPQFMQWHRWFTYGGQPLFRNWESEKIVTAQTPFGAFAGTVDLLADSWLWDYKTSKTATPEQRKKWQMQLSFYCYALRKMGVPVSEPLKVLHVGADDFEVIRLGYLGDKFVEQTMQKYVQGQTVEKPAPVTDLQTVPPQELDAFTQALVQIKTLEEQVERVRARIKQEMEARGILQVQFGPVSISYVAPTTRTSFDSVGFKKDHADLYRMYQKQSEVKSSIRITLN